MYIRRVWHPPQTNCAISVPGAGTAVTVLQTAQQTDVAPAGYMRRFRHPVQTSWLWAPLGGVNGTGGVGYGARGTGIAVPAALSEDAARGDLADSGGYQASETGCFALHETLGKVQEAQMRGQESLQR